jgi:Tol biopolymer transport system component
MSASRPTSIAPWVLMSLSSWVMLSAGDVFAPQPLYIMNADGTKLRPLVHLHDHQSTGSPMWTRDGKSILIDAWRNSEDATKAHIYRINADGTWPVDLGPGAMPSSNPNDANQIATHYYGELSGVWLSTKGQSGVSDGRQVEGNAGSPRWHPYLPKLAYVKWSGGIAMREISSEGIGDEEMIVPAELHPYVGFSWSPDGKAIAFYSNRHGEGKTELIVLDVAKQGAEPEVKDTGKVGWILSWSPDGTKIAYSNYCQARKCRQLYIAEPATNEPPQLLEGQDPTRHNYQPAWSPDGKQIAFTSLEVTPEERKD